MDERLASKHIVLLGVGHTNAHIVRMWSKSAIPDTSLTCISDNPIATYSGMLPAVLAGQIPPSAMEIDLVKLCAASGARLITDTVTHVDPNSQLVHFNDRPAIPFDALSIGIGSVPSMKDVRMTGDSVVPIKPMQTFLERLADRCIRLQATQSDTKAGVDNQAQKLLNIAVVGSGAAGIEITFCLPSFLDQHIENYQLSIVTRSNTILPGNPKSLQNRVRKELNRRNVNVVTATTVNEVTPTSIEVEDGNSIAADIVIWATGAAPPPFLAQIDLPRSKDGFLAVDNSLQTISGAPVFAVGDTGTIQSEKLPKAGVYAVRQGPVLWNNLQRILNNQKLVAYHPQHSFLKLLNKGDGTAFGERSGISFNGRWVMKLKDYIDSKFMAMFQMSGGMADSSEPMQCKGCGCKLGGDVLAEALSSHPENGSRGAEDIELDDAAVIDTAGGQIVASTDFFSSPVNDPYLAGRIAALHSASDLVAMGADVTAALANVVVPEGDPNSQRQGLDDVLTGAREEFSAMGAKLVGGHTIIGNRWEIGFTVIGQPLSTSLLRKQGLKVGDYLYVTKPLGIGVLLAAHMRAECAATDYQSLLQAMLQRQHPIAQLVADLEICAGTDITGFGLIGHLTEMLNASGLRAELSLQNIPLLPGAAAAFDSGIESSLAPANRHVECRIAADPKVHSMAEYRALFDPQTCGGLLLGVSPEKCDALEDRLQTELNIRPQKVGIVCAAESAATLVTLNAT